MMLFKDKVSIISAGLKHPFSIGSLRIRFTICLNLIGFLELNLMNQKIKIKFLILLLISRF